MTRAEVWAKNWAKFSAHFRASFAVQHDPEIFSQNSSQFITPCLVAAILKGILRELLGFSGTRGPPHFLKKRSENAGANENLSGGFAAIPGIAPRVAPRIVGFVLIKS